MYSVFVRSCADRGLRFGLEVDRQFPGPYGWHLAGRAPRCLGVRSVYRRCRRRLSGRDAFVRRSEFLFDPFETFQDLPFRVASREGGGGGALSSQDSRVAICVMTSSSPIISDRTSPPPPSSQSVAPFMISSICAPESSWLGFFLRGNRSITVKRLEHSR